MEVLIINPPNIPFTDLNILIEPIDILTLATYVQQRVSVQVLDMDVKRISATNFETYLQNKKFSHVVLVYDYHIPLHTDEAFNEIKKIAQIAHNKGSTVILIGKIATYNPSLAFYANSPIDIGITHSAEKTLTRLLQLKKLSRETLQTIPNLVFWREGEIVKTPHSAEEEYATFPIPDRSLININDYIDVRTILSSRGCSNKCSFCNVQSFRGKRQAKSPEAVVAEIQYLINTYHTEKILFLDDNATVDKERMKQIAKLLLHNNIKIKLGCLGSIKNFDQEMMEIMYQAGFGRIHYGVETGDETIARKINKPLTQKEILSTIRKTKNIGFRIRTSWILDLDPATLKKTLDLIKKTQTDEIRLHFLALRYGSEIYVSNDKNITSQYIHQGKSTQNTLGFKKEIDQLLAFLQKHGYNIRPQNKDNTSLLAGEKYVSLCPLKYGINW